MAGIMNNMPGNRSDDGSNNESTNRSSINGVDVELLRSIDSTLKQILEKGVGMSQSDARNMMPGRRYVDNVHSNSYSRSSDKWKTHRRRKSGAFDEFEDGFREVLVDSLLGSDFKDKMRSNLEELADLIGIEAQDIPYELGKEISKNLIDSFKGSSVGSTVSNTFEDIKKKSMSNLRESFLKGVEGYDSKNSTDWASKFRDIGKNINSRAAHTAANSAANSTSSQFSSGDWFEEISEASFSINEANISVAQSSRENSARGSLESSVSDVISNSDIAEEAMSNVSDAVIDNVDNISAAAGGVAASGQAAAGGLGALAAGATKVIPQIALATAAIGVLTLGVSAAATALEPLAEGVKSLWSSLKNSFNRYQKSRDENLKYEKQRLEADVKTMVEAPFEILKSAAEEWYQVWDSQLRKISGTQGYTKDDVYDLFGNYAQRLRDEGLTSVISGADISSNLTKVLESGLSGQVAEEFAYIATKLNAAIPTQDFFNYSSTYASLAANAIKNGYTQAEAIEYANAELENFASNVLYASRQLSGGFSSGLQDASSLFDASVKIVNSAKQGTVTDVSGVLTSVSAVVGSIAPDLATSIVDAVVSAATGGNSSDIVALRSLAGVNASNTEFLRMFTTDPKSIFSDLFRNLARMQNMSNDNFMEVAEGLSSVFGISMDAFARVDFNYLADAISNMNTNNRSLAENIELLASGETTTNQEQMKWSQINEYMLEEGLGYVLDNEAARSIQEHMWDEQIARELMEATYAVELTGSALEFLEGIRSTVQNIINFLNPLFYLTKGVINLSATAAEAELQDRDIAGLLEAGKVGPGNALEKSNLTTRNEDLHLVESINSMLGSFSGYNAVSNLLSGYNRSRNYDPIGNLKHGIWGALNIGNRIRTGLGGFSNDTDSVYSWGSVGKSSVDLLSKLSTSQYTNLPTAVVPSGSSSQASTDKAVQAFQDYVDSMQEYVQDGKDYDEWKRSASGRGIDFNKSLDLYGKTEDELKSHFTNLESVNYKAEREKKEDGFWTEGVRFWTETHPTWQIKMNEAMAEQIANQEEQIILHTATNASFNNFKNEVFAEFTAEHYRLLGINNTKLQNIYSKNKAFYDAWVKYYVDHKAYTEDTFNVSDVAGIKNAEKKEQGAAVLALADALANVTKLDDPQVQTNVLLAKILLVAETIMQQNNEAGNSTLPTTLAALGLGLVE